ncbi:MAG: alpha-2-macroglobulin family protein [Bacteroidota bacterium]|nr:alpha-2-macroglobulin family protein [Bacteroidota bacterium]
MSNIAYINRANRYLGQNEIVVVNRDNGKALSGINIDKLNISYSRETRSNEIIKTATLKTNKQGFVKLLPEEGRYRSNFILIFKNGKDFLIADDNFYNPGKRNKSKQKICNFFLDRKIYRPGQVVYFKGIINTGKGAKSEVVPEQKVNVQLFDANWQSLKEHEFVSNKFGSFSGSFTLPKSALTGNFTIKNEFGSINFRVEEYKRPKILVEFLPVEGQYRFNDIVQVKGTVKSYTGHPVGFAEIKYTIKRSSFGGYKSLYMPWASERQIAYDEIHANEKGEFEINFKALCPSTKDKNSKFHFTVSVDATDQNGETQSSSKRISINKNAIYIESDFPNKIDLSEIPENEFKLLVKTANGQEIDNVINVEVFQLEAPALLYPKKMQESEVYLLSRKQWHDQYSNHEYRNELDIKNYRVKKQLAKFSIDTKEKKNIVLDQLGKRLPGVYKIKFSTKDKFGREVENIVYPEFFDSQSKKLHIPKTDWFVALNKKVEPGETAKFLIGTGIAKVHILYEIFHQDKFVKQEWISLKKGQTLIEIPVEEKYRGGFNVAFTFISNNHVFSFSERVDVPFSNKDLDISFGTFREELYPGEDEQWRVTIRGHKGEKIAAEMLCGMYDASLDRFAPNRWNSFFRAPHFYLNSYSASTFNQVHAKSFYRNYKHPEWPGELYYKQLLWFGYGGYALNAGGMRGSRQSFGFMLNSRGEKGITSDAEMPMAVENSIAPVPESPMEQMEIVSQDKNKETFDEASDELKIDNVYTRSNFNETAFFYPHLQTNKDGDVVISFIMPESLTRWNINGIAHTKELDIGTFHKELISKKELMAEANPPRFFREGDRIVFPVKISNMSDKALNCLVRLEFVNALNNEKIKISVEDEQQLFSVPENGNQTLTWELNIPENVHAITYTVKALTRTFSDGEEKTIPVLTNRILVTESLPMSIRKSGKTSFGFKKLKENKSTTLKHHKLTLEFTQNPAWYAVQALPYLMKFPHECAEQIFSRYYANSLAGHIVNSMPEIKRVFEQWKISDNKETFLSNLEKNQDLKNIILNETPWVRDALNENQQKENIALLFDLNKMKDELKLAWQQLEKMQNPNGSWPWFPGLRENRYITQHIVAGMGHLKHLGVIDLNSKHSQFNAIRQAILYLDKEMYRDYIRIKSSKEIHSFLIHYLYMRSYFPDIRLSQLHETAFDHYIAEAKKDWLKFNKYEQSMIALALHRQGDTETPMDIIKSLKEFSISSDEFGMYWKSGNAYYWNEAPIEQQAMMIELFKEVAKDPQAVNELKIWLLKQKQTQAWKTTKATANAVYALLLSGDNWLDSKEELSIKIGEQTIQPAKDEDLALEAGTGYFKKSWDAGEITPTMSEITVTKSTDRLSWGAVYWQYFEDLDKITEHSAGLSMIKKLYIERKEKDKTELVLISDENMPQIGDKLIVRIHLKSDRNLEFVHMKDMRASGLEPINFLSGHRYQGGMYYYESIRDASVNFFFDGLRKGDYVFEYPLRVIHNGDFSNGITTIQCMYAPEFSAHSEGVELRIE